MESKRVESLTKTEALTTNLARKNDRSGTIIFDLSTAYNKIHKLKIIAESR